MTSTTLQLTIRRPSSNFTMVVSYAADVGVTVSTSYQTDDEPYEVLSLSSDEANELAMALQVCAALSSADFIESTTSNIIQEAVRVI